MKAGYSSTVKEFLDCNPDTVVGVLSQKIASSGISQQHSKQINVWNQQVEVLKNTFNEIAQSISHVGDWTLVLEYPIPRRQKRPDALVLTDNMVFVIEFKFGATEYDAASRWQAEDYALNLRDFHAESSGRVIVPVLCATDARPIDEHVYRLNGSLVAPLFRANAATRGTTLGTSYRILKESCNTEKLDASTWLSSVYRPTLTIIEAAETLYENHSVRDISHNYAENLSATTDMVAQAILSAKAEKKRTLILITGVPGAGKTLTGLNVVHDPSIRSKQGPSGIFLSGNGPLVKVVREALVLNEQKAGRRRNEAEHEVSTFIQNVHQFLRYHRENCGAVPHEHVVVFDESQRAWDRRQMKRKQAVDYSEPFELLSVMERTPDWSVVIGLVGGGQEIFLGEAGLGEWGRALQETTCNWNVIASPEVISGGSSVAGHRLFEHGVPTELAFTSEPLAHLTVSVRSHRAQKITDWVNQLLEPNSAAACKSFPVTKEFPLFVTRSLSDAREWLRLRSGGDLHKRCGLVCGSEDQRLRAYGLENSTSFRSGYAFEKWFLSSPDDVRSSYTLEVPATEFECQGLELDWVGLCWGGDLTLDEKRSSWVYRKFRGSKWQYCHSEVEKGYVRNRYRVLLTRARAGMVIWVPLGCNEDSTRPPEWFDRIYEHLRNAGVPKLSTFKEKVL
ncbi:DUF2075 domain-containing protein [Methylomarinum vadi]|uniref:DUF2075 domain-containing protein n=1 Tax=Methylomarinum vadi TaxID=438855 RepID=UPI00068ECEB3|nr:DUF2075 domain-containing protein [Methylomarinum vadi]